MTHQIALQYHNPWYNFKADPITKLTSDTVPKLVHSPYWPPLPYQSWLTHHIDLRYHIKPDLLTILNPYTVSKLTHSPYWPPIPYQSRLTILTSDTLSKLTYSQYWPPIPDQSWLTHYFDVWYRIKAESPYQTWLTHHSDLWYRVKADLLTILTSDTESKLATISSSPTSTASS